MAGGHGTAGQVGARSLACRPPAGGRADPSAQRVLPRAELREGWEEMEEDPLCKRVEAGGSVGAALLTLTLKRLQWVAVCGLEAPPGRHPK